MPQKTATEWERAADEVDRAEWRLLDALEDGDDAAVAAAEDELARCQRRRRAAVWRAVAGKGQGNG